MFTRLRVLRRWLCHACGETFKPGTHPVFLAALGKVGVYNCRDRRLPGR